MRIGIGRFGQETQSFSPDVTDLAAFQRTEYAYGASFDVYEPLARSPVWAFVEVAQRRPDVEIIPLISAWAGTGGPVEEAAFSTISEQFRARLDEVGNLDVVYLSLHGAMATQDHEDPEGLLVEQVRAQVGSDTWIVASADHHACLTERMVAACDLIVAHRTQPHDPPDTGRATADAFFRAIDRGFRPRVALRRAPMVTHQEQFSTACPPMSTWFDLARDMEARPGVLSVSTCPMQPWLDVADAGWSAVVYTDGDQALANELASELIRCAWDLRHDLIAQDSVSVVEAVARARAVERGIVLLSDTGDSTAGGATGDSNELLAELIRTPLRGTVLVPLVDAPAAIAASHAGAGATIEIDLGRTIDPAWGEPIRVIAEVVTVTDGRVPASDLIGAYEQGRSALLRIDDVLVAVSEFRGRDLTSVGGATPGYWAHFGVDVSEPDGVQAMVVKTASNFQYVSEWASEIIRADTSGQTQSRMDELPWRRLPPTFFPLNPDARLPMV